MILVSEIGDKTFFIAAIMAMSNGRRVIFLSAFAALVVMTVLSVVLGMALPAVMPKAWTHLASCCLFVFFGIKLLVDAYCEDGSVVEEMHEVEEELAATKSEEQTETDVEMQALTKDNGTATQKHGFFATLFSPIALQCFTMTFLAEWGDRSQISTIALAASRDPVGVCFGGFGGHAICTGIAVICGKALAYKISERVVNIVGGILFLIFAVSGFIMGPDE